MSRPEMYVLPASYGQERLWFMAQLEPDRPLHHINFWVPLAGRTDPDLLERALAEVVRRHETLRSALAMRDATVVQLVSAELEVVVPRTDLAGVPADLRDRERARISADDAARPFVLDQAPLWRARLLHLCDDDWRLLFVVHHAMFDAQSAGNLLDEIVTVYDALAEGRPVRLAEPAIQYADYAGWQRGRLSEGVLNEQLKYWQTRLQGVPSDLGLPSDRPRPARRGYAGAEHRFELPGPLAGRLAELAQQSGCTLYMALLAAYAVLLSRYAGQPDVVVGSPSGGRPVPETAPLIGMFVNTVLLRVELHADPTFTELLGQVRATVVDALDQGEVPFEKLVETLQPDRDPSRPPLHQVGFNLLPVPRQHFNNGSVPLDLNLEVFPAPDELQLYLEYSRELFDEATVRRLATSYATLLDEVVREPDRPVSRLPLLTAGERRRIIMQGTPADEHYARRCLHELFAEQAARAPDAVAVRVLGGPCLTYQELDRRSDRLAYELERRGARPGSRVAVLLPRSADLIVALLGVLKTGACYLPLDSGYPAERLAHLLSDSATELLITEAGLLEGLPEERPRTVTLDEETWHGGDAPPPRATTGSPEQAAYLIYTSGSTGRPKGVLVPHRGVVNLVQDVGRQPGFGPQDAFLLLTSLSFDISALEIFTPLLTGGTVVVATDAAVHAAGQVRSAIGERLVTTVQATPSVAEALLPELSGRPVPQVQVICGGEPLSLALAQRIQRVAAGLWNFYGPTETTIWSCRYRVPSDAATMSIGQAVANTSTFVLDAAMEPVPVGVPGELFIGGHGVAHGYWARPALTAERFVPDPFGPPGARLYRTGDLVRARADGDLEFLGRLDDQVKVRGVRTEPGEVEAVLTEHPQVRRAAVTVREDAPGGRGLVAYVGWAGEADALSAELRTHLRRRLPEPMIPVAFVAVRDFPVLPSGKLDRAALPAPGSASHETRYAPPGTPMEEQLCGIWAELLNRDRVGVTDDFFELGGHSLLAVQLMARIRETFGADIPLRRCFDLSSVTDYALAVLEELLVQGEGEMDTLLADVEEMG